VVGCNAMRAVSLKCPTCAAPLAVSQGQRLAICIYCNASVQLQRTIAPPSREEARPEPEATRAQELAPGVVERVRAMVIEGRWEDAVTHYASQAGVSTEDAEVTIKVLVGQVSTMNQLLRSAPVRPGVVALHVLVLGGALAGAVLGGLAGHRWLFVLAALAALLLFLDVRWLLPKLRSTLVRATGGRGRATVLRRTIVHPSYIKGGVVALVHFRVQPDESTPPFEDEEFLLLAEASVPKLEPGNVVRVRFSSDRDHVFPESPIEVLERVPVT